MLHTHGRAQLGGHLTDGLLELLALHEEVVLDGVRGGAWRWALEEEAQPVLQPRPLRSHRQIPEQRQVQHQGRGENRVATEKVNFNLHRITEPSEEVDVVPALFGIAPGWVVMNRNLVA